MPRIQPVEKENAPQESQPLMEAGEQNVGKMLNFFKQVAVSPASLKAYIDFDATLHDGALDEQTSESIYLATSNYNGCAY